MQFHSPSPSSPTSTMPPISAFAECEKRTFDFQERDARWTETRSPRFVQSVVEEAGFGQFVYMFGASGRRYVFSAIKPEQAWLYEGAIFATTTETNDRIRFSRLPSDDVSKCELGARMYVHLLAEEEGSGGDVLADLACSNHELVA